MKKTLLIAAVIAVLVGSIGCKKQADNFQNSLSGEVTSQTGEVGPSLILSGITGSLTLVRERNDNTRSFKYSLKGLAVNSTYYLLPIRAGAVPSMYLYPFNASKVIAGSRGTASGTIVFTSTFDPDPNTGSCSPLCFESMRLVLAGDNGSEQPVSFYQGLTSGDWSTQSYLDIITITSPGCNDRIAQFGGSLDCLTFTNNYTTATGIKLTRRI